MQCARSAFGILLESQNPHLPAAAPAGLLSRKVTGEVNRGRQLYYLTGYSGFCERILK